MKRPLSILSYGVVSGGGNALAALQQEPPWPLTEIPRLLISQKISSEETASTPTAKVDLPSLDHWRKKPRFRRSTPLSLFLAEAVSQVLNPLDSHERTGLIVVTFTGCITYSRRFYQEILEQGVRAASPMIFPETVFNSPTSHVASQHGIGGPVYSILGDESAWITGLETASLWLELGRANKVIVVAGYEIDAMAIEAYHAAGWIRKGLIPTEGAGALLLGKPDLSTAVQIVSLEQGYLYRTRQEFKKEQARLDKKMGDLPREITPWNPWISSSKMTPTLHGFPLSAAWQTIRMATTPSEKRKALPLYGSNHQAGWIGMDFR